MLSPLVFLAASAAAAGSWSCILYAYENGCPWDKRTTAAAINANRLDIYRWAVAQGCDVSPVIQARAEAMQPRRDSSLMRGALKRYKTAKW